MFVTFLEMLTEAWKCQFPIPEFLEAPTVVIVRLVYVSQCNPMILDHKKDKYASVILGDNHICVSHVINENQTEIFIRVTLRATERLWKLQWDEMPHRNLHNYDWYPVIGAGVSFTTRWTQNKVVQKLFSILQAAEDFGRSNIVCSLNTKCGCVFENFHL